MSRIKIVCDSAGDIPPELAAELGITIVPLSIRFGDRQFQDVVQLSADEFWRLAETSQELPQTAAPSPEAFADTFAQAKQDGYDGVLCICISSKLSATYQSAQLAAAEFQAGGFPVEVVDSLLATYGEGSLAVLAGRHSNADLASLNTMVRAAAGRTRIVGALDTLENLRKGGRIGAAAATLGSLLAVKPIIEVVDGVVEAPAKQRTRRRALDYLYDVVRQESNNIEQLAVISARAPDVEEFTSHLKQIARVDDVLVATIGPVIGAHAGPRTIGVCITKKAN